MSNNQQDKTPRDDLRIEWFGIDGLLCLLYVIEAIVFAYAMINDVDIIIGKIVPYGVAIVTTLVFIKYLYQVISFSRKNHKKD